MPPAVPIRLITAFAFERKGFIVTSGINATAGERNEAIEINTTSSTAINSPVRTAPAELISSAYACLAGT